MEVSKPFVERLQGGIGLKLANLSGFPRSREVREYTHSAALDFNLYYLPVVNEFNEIRIGAGYTFSFYDIRRSYPVIAHQGTQTSTTWPIKDTKGRASGVSLTGEYEYFVQGSNLSLGGRLSLFKAYDHVWFAGVFIGMRL